MVVVIVIKTKLFIRGTQYPVLNNVMYEIKTCPHIAGLAIYRKQDWTIPFVDSDGAEAVAGSEKDDGTDDSISDGDGDYNVDSYKYYALPNGTRVDVWKMRAGWDLCCLPELLFSDEIPFSHPLPLPPSLSDEPSTTVTSTVPPTVPATLSSLPVHELVHDSPFQNSPFQIYPESRPTSVGSCRCKRLGCGWFPKGGRRSSRVPVSGGSAVCRPWISRPLPIKPYIILI